GEVEQRTRDQPDHDGAQSQDEGPGRAGPIADDGGELLHAACVRGSYAFHPISSLASGQQQERCNDERPRRFARRGLVRLKKEGPSIKGSGLGGEPPSPVGRPVEGPWVVTFLGVRMS